MMPTLAPARSHDIENTVSFPIPGPGWRCAGRRGARLLCAAAFLMPLGACAALPAAPAAQDGNPPAATPAREVPTAPPAQAQTQTQDGKASTNAAASPAANTPATLVGRAASPSAPPATASSPSSSPSSAARSATPVAERATTVGEVPTTAGPVTDAPATASMPGAPAAIPGTPANPSPSATMPATAPGPSAGTLLQTILALVFVLALLAALAWGAKRFGPRMAGSSANLRMVGALNIGGRERIMVVEVGGQWIVVGASPGRVNALATMPKPEDGDHGMAGGASLAGHAPPAASFSDWLKQTIDKRNAK